MVSASYGDLTYIALPGEKPADSEVDRNDYAGILADNTYAWSGDIAVTEENFKRYNFDGLAQYELMTIENGWLTRKNEGGFTNSEDAGVRTNAYAIAQYTGVMATGDYKLSFKVKADENDHFRFSVLTRWEDKDGNSDIKFANQIGYRIYFETTDEGLLQIFCYRTGGAGRMAPLTATAANAASLSLAEVERGTLEIEVTLVMKGDLIVAEAHLATDATKTTGPVAFDMSDDLNLLGQIDRTQGFCVIDSANEAKFLPASFGDFKLCAASEPQTDSGSDGPIDPDDEIPTKASEDASSAPDTGTDETPTETEKPDTDGQTNAGCRSGISVAPFAAVLALSAVGVLLGRKQRED